MNFFKTMLSPGCLEGLNLFKCRLMTNQLKKKPNWQILKMREGSCWDYLMKVELKVDVHQTRLVIVCFRFKKQRQQNIKNILYKRNLKIIKNHQRQGLVLVFMDPKIFESAIPRKQLRLPGRRVDISLGMTSFLFWIPWSFVIMSFLFLLTQTNEIVY